MNIYVVVEGRTEKPVYKSWIPLINPNISYVNDIYDIKKNNFSIISAKNYPYYQIIEDAITDVNDVGNIDRLVISVDSEDNSREKKFEEVNSFLQNLHCVASIIVVIQHFCIETWALGNRHIIRRHPQNQNLRKYKGIFNVLLNDPELLPPLPSENLNRAQFAFKYLKVILNERYPSIVCTKRRPYPLCHPTYFSEVRSRYHDTQHIASFSDFLGAFVS
jgi:hypothetical protein